MTTHTELLNFLATTFNLQRYLEIGVQYPANNFDKIQCKSKVGVEPSFIKRYEIFTGTSDEYFAYPFDKRVDFGLIFIDGLHHYYQVKRDFENSLHCLTDSGFIVIHDTCPEKEEHTHVPRDSKIWNGDVWKFAVTLGQYPEIEFRTLDFDHGCSVVWKSNKNFAHNIRLNDINWETFQANKKYFLHIISEQRFIQEMTLKINSESITSS